MGIRFFCLHCGHNLNVKAAQAGLDGICPSCQHVIKIPDPAFVAVGEELPSLPALATDDNDLEQITAEGLDPVSRQESEQLDIDPGMGEGAAGRNGRRFRTAEPEEQREAFVLGKPTPTIGTGDPLKEAPSLIWYYREKDHAERGPLKAKVMQAELEKGKISLGSLVWREDWEAWLPVEKVFPQLFPALLGAADSEGQVRMNGLAKVLHRFRHHPRNLNVLLVLICGVLIGLIATAAWLVLK